MTTTDQRQPTIRQRAAINYLNRHTGPVRVVDICAAAGVQGDEDDRYAFVGRLIDCGLIAVSTTTSAPGRARGDVEQLIDQMRDR
jgi:hypothetical protein